MASDVGTEDEGKRAQRAKHEYLDAGGSPTKAMSEACGVKYTDIATGENFEFLIPGATAGSPQTMLAVFGAKTLATNEASQVRQAVARGEEVEGSEVDGIIARFDLLEKGTWREVGEGRIGVKVDRDALAAAIVEAQAKLGKTRDLLEIRQRLDDDVAFFRKARKADDVTAIYNAKVGKETKPLTSGDLF